MSTVGDLSAPLQDKGSGSGDIADLGSGDIVDSGNIGNIGLDQDMAVVSLSTPPRQPAALEERDTAHGDEGNMDELDSAEADIGEIPAQVEISLNEDEDGDEVDLGRASQYSPTTAQSSSHSITDYSTSTIEKGEQEAAPSHTYTDPHSNDESRTTTTHHSLSPPHTPPPALFGPHGQAYSPRPQTLLSPRSLASPRLSPPTTNSADLYRPGEMPNYSRTLPTATSPRAGMYQHHDHNEENNYDDDVDDDAHADPNAPFESIPLESTPPLGIPLPLPFSPRGQATGTPPSPRSPGLNPPSSPGASSSKRMSWGGFGMTKDGERIANGIVPTPTSGPVDAEEPSASTSTAEETISVEPPTPTDSQSGTSTSGRRHAPPAHPHPFPIPSTPEIPKRNSITSITSQPPLPSNASATGSPGSTHTHALGVANRGVSMLDKVISQTRPSYLPPKDKTEDELHLHQWEEMMAQSREAEKERKKHIEARRIDREKKLAISTPKWEALLAAPDFSSTKVKGDPEMRKLWFEGVPSHLRGKAWAVAIGNPLAMSKDAYKSYSARAKRALDSGRFPKEILDRIEHDLDETLVSLHIFRKGSPVRDDVKELLCAYIVYRSDDGLGYPPYINLIAAMFILVSPPPIAFLSMVNLLSRPCLRAFFTETRDEIDAFYRVFENLQADTFPKIFANCKNLGLKLPESYFRSLLVEQVPFEAVCRLWDQIMLDGDGFIFRAALAIFGFLEPRLHYPDREEILSVLEGRNPATMAIAERERERARLRGEAYEDALDGKLSVFGLHEKALFDWLENDGWKESRFERLVVREMPD